MISSRLYMVRMKLGLPNRTLKRSNATPLHLNVSHLSLTMNLQATSQPADSTTRPGMAPTSELLPNTTERAREISSWKEDLIELASNPELANDPELHGELPYFGGTYSSSMFPDPITITGVVCQDVISFSDPVTLGDPMDDEPVPN